MQLYLSSYRMGDRFQELLDMTGPRARVAVIANACDFIPDADRRAYAASVHDPIGDFRAAGLEAFDLDLRAWFGRGSELSAALAQVRMVWATGGNAFLLRRAMRQSGFDAAMRARRDDRDFVYGGWSAGAVVAGPTLTGLEAMDDPAQLAAGYDPEPVWEGLGLIDEVIVPHFQSEHPESEAAAQAAAALAAAGVPYRTLRDGEAMVVRTEAR
jgi:dipeptidase E